MARFSLVVALTLGLVVSTGCRTVAKRQQEERIWEGVKIGELTPPRGDRLPQPQFLGTVHVSVYVMELPADNVDRLDGIWQVLAPGTIRMNSYNAFSDNSFRVKFGRMEIWDSIQELFAEAGGQQAATMSLVVPDNDTTDLPIANLPVARRITFVSNNLSKQVVNVGPGVLTLRLRAEPIPGARGIRKIIAYPVHTLPVAGTIPELQLQARRQEFYFAPAAFALQMSPGDLVVLGPDQYSGERATLGGLFFNNPEGTLFFNPSKRTPPQHKPAVRVYILVCTGISD